MRIKTLNESINNDISSLLDKAYEGSYYTIVGCGGNLEEWKKGYQAMLNKNDIGQIKEWITFKGSDMNTKYSLTGDVAYPDDLTFLAFPLDGLDGGKLAMFKLRMGDRWFDDIVDNNNDHMSINEDFTNVEEIKQLSEENKSINIRKELNALDKTHNDDLLNIYDAIILNNTNKKELIKLLNKEEKTEEDYINIKNFLYHIYDDEWGMVE